MNLYETQKQYFEAAYKKGEHGWPVSGVSAPIVRFLKRFQSEQKTGRVLDIGCGEGRHTTFFAEAGYQSVGLDYQKKALARAASVFKGDTSFFQLVQGDVFHLPFLPGRFDVLIDYGCLHHVRRRDTQAYLNSVVPLLRPGGYFLLCCFSEHFKHHADERRTRDWLVHQGHYDRFFRQGDFSKIFGASFDVLEIKEEREALYAFYYVLMKKKD